MTTVNHEKLAHSSDVRMHLSVNGHVLSIGHLGPGYVILDHPIDLPPSDAEISISVDGKESRWRVKLVDGLSTTKPRSRISAPG